MDVCEAEIRELTSAIWAASLGLMVVPMAEGDEANAVVGAVQIRGAWDGVVAVGCSRELAHRAATLMLGIDEVTNADLIDVMGELANQVGGNIKAMLPGPSVLSLPRVGSADAVEPARSERIVLIREVWFDCAGERMVVRLIATPSES